MTHIGPQIRVAISNVTAINNIIARPKVSPEELINEIRQRLLTLENHLYKLEIDFATEERKIDEITTDATKLIEKLLSERK
jgi:cob(I)alamin adenosyltransferase